MTITYLLQHIFSSNAFKARLPEIHLRGNQLTGAIAVTEANRKRLLKRMNFKHRFQINKKKIGEVYLAEKSFKYKDGGFSKPITYTKTNLGYTQDQLVESTQSVMEELLDLVLYVKRLDKVVGYFNLEIEFTRYEKVCYMTVELKEMYIGIEHRAHEYWLDLTIAVIELLNAMISNLYIFFDDPTELEIKLNSDIGSSSGQRVIYTVLKEVRKNLASISRKHHNPYVSNFDVMAYYEVNEQFHMNDF